MDLPVNALLAALQQGGSAGAGPVTTPGANRYLTRTQNNYADQARLQAEDEANFARLAAQRGAAPPLPDAPQQGGISGGYNRLVNALNPQGR